MGETAWRRREGDEIWVYIQDIPNRKDCSGCLHAKALMRQRRNECAEFDGKSMAHCVQFDRLLQSN